MQDPFITSKHANTFSALGDAICNVSARVSTVEASLELAKIKLASTSSNTDVATLSAKVDALQKTCEKYLLSLYVAAGTAVGAVIITILSKVG